MRELSTPLDITITIYSYQNIRIYQQQRASRRFWFWLGFIAFLMHLFHPPKPALPPIAFLRCTLRIHSGTHTTSPIFSHAPSKPPYSSTYVWNVLVPLLRYWMQTKMRSLASTAIISTVCSTVVKLAKISYAGVLLKLFSFASSPPASAGTIPFLIILL